MAGVIMLELALEVGGAKPISVTLAGSTEQQQEILDIEAMVISYTTGVAQNRLARRADGGNNVLTPQ